MSVVIVVLPFPCRNIGFFYVGFYMKFQINNFCFCEHVCEEVETFFPRSEISEHRMVLSPSVLMIMSMFCWFYVFVCGSGR